MSLIQMVVQSPALHFDTLMAYAFREAVGIDGAEAYERKRLRKLAEAERMEASDWERLMNQRTGALDRGGSPLR